jgi:hypothetical protein
MKRVTRDVTPGCEWVLAGEGRATRKIDGTACMVRDRVLYKRYDAKKGRTPPQGFEPAQPEPDPITGHWPGWLAVGDGPDDQYHQEALANATDLSDGTYEMVGPKVQGNPEGYEAHELIPHGADEIRDVDPRSYDALAEFFSTNAIEGIVWWHEDGRMAKVKRRDFGFEWPIARDDRAPRRVSRWAK